MTIGTLFRYLFLLDRQAIQDIAACRKAAWIGLLFVLSAGFAREYDGEDLFAEPWHLFLPLGASLVTSVLLFGVIWLIDAGWKRQAISFDHDFRRFLGLFWMTAPLAWLYAIPVERFCLPARAVEANLWLLGIVATWRVALMVRVVSEVFRISLSRSVFPVFFFADSLMVVILFLTPLPVFSIMGGIRLTESEQLLQATAFLTGAIGILSWPVWLIGTVVIATRPIPRRTDVVPASTAHHYPTQALWMLAIASLAIWTCILPFTQPEQQRRRQVEALLKAGHIEQALEIMSAHERRDFPPHWDPPPRIGFGERDPDVPNVLEVLIAAEIKPWVSELYWDKFRDLIGHGFEFHNYWQYLDEAEFDRHLVILEHVPKNSPILAEQRGMLETLSKGGLSATPLTNEQQERLRKLLGEVKNDGLQPGNLAKDSEEVDDTLKIAP